MVKLDPTLTINMILSHKRILQKGAIILLSILRKSMLKTFGKLNLLVSLQMKDTKRFRHYKFNRLEILVLCFVIICEILTIITHH